MTYLYHILTLKIESVLNWINWTNGISLLGFLPLLAEMIHKYQLYKKTEFLALKEIFDFEFFKSLIFGTLIFLFALFQNSSEGKEKKELSEKINTLLDKREVDSANNASFQKYLKDTFGIIIQGNKPIIYNTKIYNSQIEQPKLEGLADSINYQYSFENDTLRIVPKQGTWVHAFLAYDTAHPYSFKDGLDEGMGTANIVDKISINGKIFNTHLFKIYDRPVYKGNPIKINLL